MRYLQEVMFSLMILVGLSMILYDVIKARTVARTMELKHGKSYHEVRSLVRAIPSNSVSFVKAPYAACAERRSRNGFSAQHKLVELHAERF